MSCHHTGRASVTGVPGLGPLRSLRPPHTPCLPGLLFSSGRPSPLPPEEARTLSPALPQAQAAIPPAPPKPVHRVPRTSPRQLLSRQQLPDHGNQSPGRQCADSVGSGRWEFPAVSACQSRDRQPRLWSPPGRALSHQKRLFPSAPLPLIPSTWNLHKTKVSSRFPL